jgi:1-acyl-sn-glycerol-3-phosphate acyltransferase
MIYNFLQFFVKVALRFYFRTIYFLNEEAIPDNQPVIIAANHSNSAMDALLISGLYKRKDLYWLARGDVFKNKWIAKFMYACKTAPIYRSSEVGFVDIKRNNASFEICFQLLDQNKMVGLFPEGITIHERKMQTPFKKGLARLALQAHQKLGKPIMIVPVGVSYQSLSQPNTDAFVYFGEPFTTSLFFDLYQADQTKALKDFTNYLEEKLAKEIINYDNVTDQKRLNDLLISNENSEAKFGLNRDNKQFFADQNIVNQLIEEEKNGFSSKNEMTDILKNEKFENKKSNNIIIFICQIFFQISKILYFLPNQLSKLIIKTKIKKSAFWGTVRFVVLYFGFPIYTFSMALIGKLHTNTTFWLILFGLPIITYLGLKCSNIISKSRI